MPTAGFKPTILAGEWPQTYALHHMATETGTKYKYKYEYNLLFNVVSLRSSHKYEDFNFNIWYKI